MWNFHNSSTGSLLLYLKAILTCLPSFTFSIFSSSSAVSQSLDIKASAACCGVFLLVEGVAYPLSRRLILTWVHVLSGTMTRIRSCQWSKPNCDSSPWNYFLVIITLKWCATLNNQITRHLSRLIIIFLFSLITS